MNFVRKLLDFVTSLFRTSRSATSTATLHVDVIELVGEYCITSDDGDRIYDVIHPALKVKQRVDLDFAGVDIFASPFFNAAIGRLYADISGDELALLLKVLNVTQDGLYVLARVIENSREYYSVSQRRRAVNESLIRHASGF